jgi:hypothetical protein
MDLAAGVIADNEPIAGPGTVSAAFAALSHNRAIRTGKLASSVAAGGVVAALQAVIITGTDDARIELEELTLPRLATHAAPAWVEDRTFFVFLAQLDATLASTALEALQTCGDRLDAQTLDAGV